MKMSADIAFKIQLGMVLPKLNAQLTDSLSAIVEEVMVHLKDGTLAAEESVNIDDVKALFMQNLEIFLDTTVLPPLDKKFNPVVVEVAVDAAVGESKSKDKKGK